MIVPTIEAKFNFWKFMTTPMIDILVIVAARGCDVVLFYRTICG